MYISKTNWVITRWRLWKVFRTESAESEEDKDVSSRNVSDCGSGVRIENVCPSSILILLYKPRGKKQVTRFESDKMLLVVPPQNNVFS
jgi:hypothetical protein